MHILNRKEEIDQTKKYLLFDQYENREKSQLDADPHPSLGNIIVARQQQQQQRRQHPDTTISRIWQKAMATTLATAKGNSCSNKRYLILKVNPMNDERMCCNVTETESQNPKRSRSATIGLELRLKLKLELSNASPSH